MLRKDRWYTPFILHVENLSIIDVHGVETLCKVDTHWNMLIWGSMCIYAQSAEVWLSVSGGQPLFVLG